MRAEPNLHYTQPITPTYQEDEHQPLLHRNASNCDNLNSSTMTSISDNNKIFKDHWTAKSSVHNLEIQKYILQEKTYHEGPSIIKNLQSSLANAEKMGTTYYTIHSIWIPFMYQKYIVLSIVQPDLWMSEFKKDFNELVQVILAYIMKYYINTLASKQIQTNIFTIISQYITQHKKWEKFNELFLNTISRSRSVIQSNKNISLQAFDLNPLTVLDLTFKEQVTLLREAYLTPSIKIKTQKMFEFLKYMFSIRNTDQLEPTIQSCIFLSKCEGFSQIIQYIEYFSILNETQKSYFKVIKTRAKKLDSRDISGFTNFGQEDIYNQHSWCNKSWKFLHNQRACFIFNTPTRVSHKQPNWQSLLSWNFLKSNCELILRIHVPKNFIKLGVISGEYNHQRDLSFCQNAITYCFSTGKLVSLNTTKTHVAFKKNLLREIRLKVSNNVLSWSATDGSRTFQVGSVQLDEGQISKSRVIIIFRKGQIQAQAI